MNDPRGLCTSRDSFTNPCASIPVSLAARSLSTDAVPHFLKHLQMNKGTTLGGNTRGLAGSETDLARGETENDDEK